MSIMSNFVKILTHVAEKYGEAEPKYRMINVEQIVSYENCLAFASPTGNGTLIRLADGTELIKDDGGREPSFTDSGIKFFTAAVRSRHTVRALC